MPGSPEDLPPHALARLDALTDQIHTAAREIFAAGVRAGQTPAGSAGTTFAAWRGETLAALIPGTWKHSVADLIPGPRFRPFEIYTKQRDELQRRHENHNNLNVGTHNALADLVRDGVVVKIDDGLYAPAFAGVAIAANADDPASFYRPRSPIGDSYALLLGFERWTFGILEWNVVNLARTYDPGFMDKFRDRPSPEVAQGFAELAAREDGDGGLASIAEDYRRAVAERHSLEFARPCTRVDGKPGLTFTGDGAHGAVDWSLKAIVDLCQQIEATSARANALLHARIAA